jgi:hypothetical protein
MTRFTPLWQQGGEYAATEDRRLVGSLWPSAAITGFAVSAQGGGFRINVAAGGAAIPAPDQSGSLLCVSDGIEQVDLDLPGTGGTENRIDLIAIELHGTELGLTGEPGFDVIAIRGQFAAAPLPPGLPPGCLSLAQIAVNNGAVTIAPGNITDLRPSQQLAVARRTAVYDLATDIVLTATTAQSLMSGTFTPSGRSVKVELAATGFNNVVLNRTFLRVSINPGGTSQKLSAPMSGSTNSAFYAGGLALFSGLTPGQAYAFSIDGSVETGGTFRCRAATQPTLENMRMMISDA